MQMVHHYPLVTGEYHTDARGFHTPDWHYGVSTFKFNVV